MWEDVGRFSVKHQGLFKAKNKNRALGPSLCCGDVSYNRENMSFSSKNKVRGIPFFHSEGSWVLFKSNTRPRGTPRGAPGMHWVPAQRPTWRPALQPAQPGWVLLVSGFAPMAEGLGWGACAACYLLPRVFQAQTLATWRPSPLKTAGESGIIPTTASQCRLRCKEMVIAGPGARLAAAPRALAP